jgi:peptidoglycan/LPS O-acetylase OafA/YrhL
MTSRKKTNESATTMPAVAVASCFNRGTTALGEVSSTAEIAFSGAPVAAVPPQERGAAQRATMPKDASEMRGRSLPLDMLRGVAILLVLGRHYVVFPENFGWLQPVAGGWTTIGWAGVDLFFVLSGFLVSGLLFGEYRKYQAVDVRRFVIRRGFKIWPAYFVYVAFVAAWVAWKQSGEGVWAAMWPNVFHVQNYFHTPRVHTWSLAVEEHFYLAVALGFFWALRSGHAAAILRRLPTIILGLVVGIAALRTSAYWADGPQALNIFATHLRFDGLLIGTLLAYWTHFEREKITALSRHPGWLLVVGIALAAPVLILSPEANVYTVGLGLTALYVGFGCVLIGWLNLENKAKWAQRMFASRPAAMLGQVGFYSYSIYLWHVDLAQVPVKKLAELALRAQLPVSLVWLGATALYVCAAFLVGKLLGRMFEMPALKLRDRLFPSATRAIAR